jgi:hypothetical protein
MTGELGIVRPVDRLDGESTRESARFLLDPLQRQRELVEHYDRHGYPERARYLEGADDGRALLKRLRTENATRDLLVWWTGWTPIEVVRLERSTLALGAAETRLRSAGAACPEAALERLREQRHDAAATCRGRLEAALSAGLMARVNTYLSPLGTATADTIAHVLLSAWRQLACGRLAAQAPLPAVTLPGGMRAHVIYCERCTVVDLHRRPARRCRRCANRHDREPGTIRIPKMHASLPWFVEGDAILHLHSCEVCAEPFLGNRDARTCGDRCRVRAHRERQRTLVTS